MAIVRSLRAYAPRSNVQYAPAAQMGGLIQKIQGQPTAERRNPPMVGPSTGPRPRDVPKIPRAIGIGIPRTIVVIAAAAAACIIAAPIPCKARQATRAMRAVLKAQPAEAIRTRKKHAP